MFKAKRGISDRTNMIAPGIRGQDVCAHIPEGATGIPKGGWANQDSTPETLKPYTDPRDSRIPKGERI